MPVYNFYAKYINEALPGVLGNRGKRAFISGEHGNEQGNKDNIGEQGTYENKFSMFGEQGNKPIYFRGTRKQVPPPWEGLINQ